MSIEPGSPTRRNRVTNGKIFPRIWFIAILAILILWTLYMTAFPPSTITLRLKESARDFMINQKYKKLPLSLNINEIQRTLPGRLGIEEMSRSSVVVMGVGKNVAEHLQSVLYQVNVLSSLFRQSFAVFVESDSTDATSSILRNWASKSPTNRTVLFLYNQTREIEKSGAFMGNPLPREGRIAEARNLGLSYIRRHLSPSYIIIIDLDQIGWDTAGVIDSFGRKNWDVICSYGTFLHGLYRDSYAFRIDGLNTNHHRCGADYKIYNITLTQKKLYRIDVQTSKARTHKLMSKSYVMAMKLKSYRSDYNDQRIINLRNSNSSFKIDNSKLEGLGDVQDKILFPVNSCFGGLAIYRTSAMADCEYDFRHKEYPYFQDCEHVLLHECMVSKNKARIYSNPFMKLWYGHNPITRSNIEKELRHIIYG